MRLSGLWTHLGRLTRELGRQVPIGSRRYKVKGYLASQFAVNLNHERHLAKPVRIAMAKRPGHFIDVGVNNGQMMLRVLSIDPLRPYIGFEPQSACCAMAQQFIRDNSLSNVRVLPVALSDREQLLPIYASSPCDETASLLERSRTRHSVFGSCQYVAARRGDDALVDLDARSPAIIKIDVEGAELSVLEGLSSTIQRARPICFFEVLPNYTGSARASIDPDAAASNRRSAKAIFAFFEAMAYSIYQIDAQGDEHQIPSFDLDSPDAFCGSDYVAHPA
jgi:FkbM family methyltransferase